MQYRCRHGHCWQCLPHNTSSLWSGRGHWDWLQQSWCLRESSSARWTAAEEYNFRNRRGVRHCWSKNKSKIYELQALKWWESLNSRQGSWRISAPIIELRTSSWCSTHKKKAQGASHKSSFRVFPNDLNKSPVDYNRYSFLNDSASTTLHLKKISGAAKTLSWQLLYNYGTRHCTVNSKQILPTYS